ncbi:MAG: hypothetical protein L3J65_11015 [Robiginitomaculum sp.]|nr:hypothetical protein [Robiginitomaculum sp.]
MPNPQEDLAPPNIEGTLTVIVNGQRIDNLTEAGIRDMPFFEGQDRDALIAGALTRRAKQADVDVVRPKIRDRVGDTASLLGTSADAAQLAVVFMLVDIVTLENTTTYANYKAMKLQMLGTLAGVDHITGDPVDVPALAQHLITKLQSGEIQLTASIKGLANTLDEIMGRATGVAIILQEVLAT